MSELSLWLDSYDDIYSDFDSRQYVRRRISEDFLEELRQEMKYRDEYFSDMVLLLPQNYRQENTEAIIAGSIKDFFTRRFHYFKEQCRRKMNSFLLLLISGVLVMLVNSWFNFKFDESFMVTMMRILLEPAGWFLIWAAFDSLFYDFLKLKKERKFYMNLSEMHIHFKSSQSSTI